MPAQNFVDVAASGISLTPDRLRTKTLWSKPYSAVRRSALIRAEDSHEGYSDFKHFAVVPESVAQTHAEKHLPKISKLHFAATLEQGIESLVSGKIDALGTGSISAIHQAQRNRRLKVINLHQEEDEPELISFAVRKEKSLLNSLNEFIRQKRSEDSY